MMPVHSGPVTAFMLLLLVAGVQKVMDPGPTAGALRSAMLPSARGLVRLLGAGELAVAGAFLVVGGPVPAALGAGFYVGFAGFVVYALVRDLPISSCGCLGSIETPPSPVHVVLDVGAATVLVLAAIIPVAPLGGLAGQGLDVVIPYTVLTGAATYLLYALLTVLPLVGRRALRLADPLPIPTRRGA